MQIVLHPILFLSFLPLVLLLLSAHKHNSALCYSVKKLEKNQTQITHLGGAEPHADRSVLNRLCAIQHFARFLLKVAKLSKEEEREVYPLRLCEEVEEYDLHS